jgi:hypothetical protein
MAAGQIGGSACRYYRRLSQRVTVMAVTGPFVMPRAETCDLGHIRCRLRSLCIVSFVSTLARARASARVGHTRAMRGDNETITQREIFGLLAVPRLAGDATESVLLESF